MHNYFLLKYFCMYQSTILFSTECALRNEHWHSTNKQRSHSCCTAIYVTLHWNSVRLTATYSKFSPISFKKSPSFCCLISTKSESYPSVCWHTSLYSIYISYSYSQTREWGLNMRLFFLKTSTLVPFPSLSQASALSSIHSSTTPLFVCMITPPKSIVSN